MSKTCSRPGCDRGCYGDFCLMHKPRKPLPRPTRRIIQVSPKQRTYLDWLEAVARPFIIARDGNRCRCCLRPAFEGEKLDIEHEKGKGPHPELKRDLRNLRLYCRIPCHTNKTDGKICEHKMLDKFGSCSL